VFLRIIWNSLKQDSGRLANEEMVEKEDSIIRQLKDIDAE
jgi:hypothetical protein